MDSNTAFPDRGKLVLVVTTITFVLATVFVLGRIVSRFWILRSRTADDYFMIAAWLLAFGLSFAIDYGTSRGLGRHNVDIPDSWFPALRRSEYAFTILYNPALMVSKTSILIFYLRLAKNTQTMLRAASYVTLAVVNIDGVVLTFLNAFQCRPVNAAYDPSVSVSKCISIVTLYLCSAPVNIITDLAILVLPIPVLTGMRLPQRQKTVLVLTFALGIFVTIVDVVRIYYLQKAANDQVMSHGQLGTGVDFAWNAATALMWSAVEVNVGIICACIPTLKPLIKRILPSMITDRSRTSTDKTNSSSQVQMDMPNGQPVQQLSVEDPVPSIQPLPPAEVGGNQEDEMNMMDFLTMPGMDPATIPSRSKTNVTENSLYFGFVNMRKPKSMLNTSGMESFKYCTIVTILFFLWGFSYGLLNTLNGEISQIAHQSTSQNLFLTTAYFGAYFCGPLTVGQWVLRHAGFKATFISGLCIYGVGTLMFWPSAVLTSFPGFILSNFVVGFGLSVLETAANPFLALCGPLKHAEFRLLLAQGVQGVGSILSQLLAQKVLFSNIVDNPSLIDVQWTYLAVALFTVILALFFYYMPLPEANDSDLELLAESSGIYPSQKLFSTRLPVIYATLALAVFAQFVYTGAQESMSAWFEALLISLRSSRNDPLTLKPDDYVLVGHTTFAIGRFLFAPLCLIIPPRVLLLTTFVGGTVFSALMMGLDTSPNGIGGIASIFFFFEGPVWPIAYAIGLRGLGRKTKAGAACITAAASGGAIFPFVMWGVQKIDGKDVQYSFCVVVAAFAFGTLFPLYLNLVPAARKQVDPVKGDGSMSLACCERNEDVNHDRQDTPVRRFNRRVSVIISKIGGDVGKRKTSAELPVVEHREMTSGS